MRLLLAWLISVILAGCVGEPQPTDAEGASALSLGCDSETVDLLLLISVTPEERLRCFEDRTISIEGVRVEPFGAGGCPGEQVPGDGWLRPCVLDGMLLAPDEESTAIALLVLFHPDTGIAPSDIPAGVPFVVTGHFDDAAASDCRLLVGQDEVADPATIEQCRQQFVATAVEEG